MCDPCVPCCSPCDPCGFSEGNQRKSNEQNSVSLERCQSRELRAGILYTNCDCVKRNGLQDDCQRSACMGQVSCLTRPSPSCCPSKYALRYCNVTMGTRKSDTNLCQNQNQSPKHHNNSRCQNVEPRQQPFDPCSTELNYAPVFPYQGLQQNNYQNPQPFPFNQPCPPAFNGTGMQFPVAMPPC